MRRELLFPAIGGGREELFNVKKVLNGFEPVKWSVSGLNHRV